MSRWFFDNKKRQEVLLEELTSWIGTPFRHMAAVKKVGVDCTNFVGSVLESVGAWRNVLVRMPYYGHDWCYHTTDERLYKGLKSIKENVELPLGSEVKNGDIVVYQFGLAASHCGIYFNREIYQAVNVTGVHSVLFIDKLWHKRRKFLFRVKNV